MYGEMLFGLDCEEEDDEWLSYGYESEKFTGTPEEICQIESEFYAAVFSVLDMDDSGSVNGDEFLSLAETLTGEVAFGDSTSFK